MAWTIHLILGIAVMIASAHKIKYYSSDHDPSNQNVYANQEPLEIPINLAYEWINTRSAETSHPVYPLNIPDEEKRSQFRIEKPTRLSENKPKVLSSKLHAESRRGQINDNSKIVFPGPKTEEFRLEIPDHCKKLGICEDIPNYPQELADKLILQIRNGSVLQTDNLDLPGVPDITHRVGSQEDYEELCKYNETVYFPKAAIDSNGIWHVVLNQNGSPLQGFNVEICKVGPIVFFFVSVVRLIFRQTWQAQNFASSLSVAAQRLGLLLKVQVLGHKGQDKSVDSSPCSEEFAKIQPGYEARCEQKHVYRKMAVLLENKTLLEKYLKVPSCCSCVLKYVIGDKHGL